MVDTGRVGGFKHSRPDFITGIKMIGGGKKFERTEKSKFKPKREKDTFKQFRNKHKDKAAYRLQKAEKSDEF